MRRRLSLIATAITSYPCRRFAVPCLCRCLTAAHITHTGCLSFSPFLFFLLPFGEFGERHTNTLNSRPMRTNTHTHVRIHARTHIVTVIQQSQTTNALERPAAGNVIWMKIRSQKRKQSVTSGERCYVVNKVAEFSGFNCFTNIFVFFLWKSFNNFN